MMIQGYKRSIRARQKYNLEEYESNKHFKVIKVLDEIDSIQIVINLLDSINNNEWLMIKHLRNISEKLINQYTVDDILKAKEWEENYK